MKKEFFAAVDSHRRPDSIVATVSSGLSIAEMAQGPQRELPPELPRHPPLQPAERDRRHRGDPARRNRSEARRLRRRDARATASAAGHRDRDMPAFAGNRVGFKVLNEVAQLAEQHGVAFIDYLIGPYTGRAMPPLATIDLVGWDVHKAIVDNVHANTNDEAHDAFALPAYMAKLIDDGPPRQQDAGARAASTARRRKASKTSTSCSIPKSGEYQRARTTRSSTRSRFVEQMRELHRVGRYREAFKVFARRQRRRGRPRANGDPRLRQLRSESRRRQRGRARSRATSIASWASASTGRRPRVLVDVDGREGDDPGAREARSCRSPRCCSDAKPGSALFREPHVNIGRFFAG